MKYYPARRQKLMSKKVQYYSSFSEDIISSENQSATVPDGYEWIRTGLKAKISSALIYGTAVVLGCFWCKAALHISYKNRQAVNSATDGCFIFSNHTQPFGDVVLPAFLSLKKRVYTIVSPANLGIPVIGRSLPALGALPIPSGLNGMKSFLSAVGKRASGKNCVVIYPEAHVWQYYTKIRPFQDTSFRFPCDLAKPAFAKTVTNQTRRFGSRPMTTIYLDGPFNPDNSLNPKQRRAELCSRVKAAMVQKSKLSTYEYIKYVKRGDQTA